MNDRPTTDVAILGAYQVAQNGDLANWRVGAKGVPAVGGADRRPTSVERPGDPGRVRPRARGRRRAFTRLGT